MNFPDWAPSFLVYEYTLIEGGNPLDLNYSEELAVHFKPILFRLLTNADMQSVWEGLKSLSNDKQEDSAVHRLWVTVRRAVMHFNSQIDKTQTAGEKKKSLTAIAKRIKEIRSDILANAHASTRANELIHSQMAKANLHFRLAHGERPKPSDYRYVNVLFSCDQSAWKDLIFDEEMASYSGDPDKAPYLIVDKEIGTYAANPAASPRAISWREQPLLNRLGHWATWGNELNFIELLDEYADWLVLDADYAPEIKQPGRGRDALKPFLIRRLHDWAIHTYQQPLDQIVAVITTTVLDLPSPLSRDDVRPYLDKDRE